ncbi:MAG: ATP-binding protein [Eubacteriales bacterium]
MAREIFPTLIGNKRLKSILSEDSAKGKTAHAYILEGPHGSGKHTAALLLCASNVCEHRNDEKYPLPCGECKSCRKILSGNSVDVLNVAPEDGKASIGVDRIRLVKQSLYIAPNDGEKKFYIISDADLMTTQAQNALLLSLEEPPEYVMFFLLCSDSSLLLETVRSRAPVIKTEKFPPSFVEEYLEGKYKKLERDKIVYAAHLSGGSLGRASELYENGKEELKLYKTAGELIRILLAGKQSESFEFIRNEMPKERRDTCEVLSLAKFALRDLIAEKKGGELLFYSEKEGVPAFSKKISARRILDLYSALSDAEDDLGANCSQNTVLSSLIMNQ